MSPSRFRSTKTEDYGIQAWTNSSGERLPEKSSSRHRSGQFMHLSMPSNTLLSCDRSGGRISGKSVGSTVSMKENPAAPIAAVMAAHIPCIGQSPCSVRWKSTIPRFPFTRMSPTPSAAESEIVDSMRHSVNSLPSTMKFSSARRRESRSVRLPLLSASNLRKASASA